MFAESTVNRLVRKKLKTFVAKTLLKILAAPEETIPQKIAYQMVIWIELLLGIYSARKQILIAQLNKITKSRHIVSRFRPQLIVLFPYNFARNARLVLSARLFSMSNAILFSSGEQRNIGVLDDLLFIIAQCNKRCYSVWVAQLAAAYYISVLKTYIACKIFSSLVINHRLQFVITKFGIAATVENIRANIKFSSLAAISSMLAIFFAFLILWNVKLRLHIRRIKPSRRICYIKAKPNRISRKEV